MIKPSIDDMFSGRQSKYSLVIAVAKRAREIAAKIEKDNVITVEKPVNVAIADFKAHKYTILEPEVDD